jgi:hypothetical protein
MRTLLGLIYGLGLAGCGREATGPALGSDLAAGGSPPHAASASGAGHFTNPANGVFVRDVFTALMGADGTVSGEYQRVAGAAIIHGSVTCLRVVGNEARIGGTIDRAFFTAVGIGSDFFFRVIDNGEGGDTEDLFSKVAFNQPAGAAASFCDTGVEPVPLPLDEREGNVKVEG